MSFYCPVKCQVLQKQTLTTTEWAANMFSSPLLNPPYSFRSTAFQPVLVPPRLSCVHVQYVLRALPVVSTHVLCRPSCTASFTSFSTAPYSLFSNKSVLCEIALSSALCLQNCSNSSINHFLCLSSTSEIPASSVLVAGFYVVVGGTHNHLHVL